jgi:hypothetical protein
MITDESHTMLFLDIRAYLNSIKKITRLRILTSTHALLCNLEELTQNLLINKLILQIK